MAPSESVQGDETLSGKVKSEKEVPNGGQRPVANGTAKAPTQSEQGGKTTGEPKEKQLSGKEKKELAKAQKIAKRAAEKQKQQGQPAVDLVAGNKTHLLKEAQQQGHAGAAIPPSKSQHKRTGSTNASPQSALPTRQALPHAAPIPADSAKENKNVALFDHLYGHPRRTTIAGAGKDVHPAVLALGLQIRNYIICGSSARCVAMLLSFKRVIESYTTPARNSLPRHLTTHLSSQIEYLVSCRPLSISMGNAIRWLKVEISNVDVGTSESQAKSDLCDLIDTYVREKVTVADRVIANKVNDKIEDGDVIMTFAKSSIVQQTLVEAFERGKKFRVIVIDSRPLFEGKNLARALAHLGLEVQYSLTHGISQSIKHATKVLLGAHAMMSTGLYSRVGTALVAMSAKNANVPVIVCCESVKLTERVALDSFVHNEVAPAEELIIQGKTSSPLSKWGDVPNLQLLNLMYDLTPADFISMVVTEYGIIAPSSVPVIIRLSTNT
ncbi:translation initiation factor eif-2b delta subunit [Usnea florida]